MKGTLILTVLKPVKTQSGRMTPVCRYKPYCINECPRYVQEFGGKKTVHITARNPKLFMGYDEKWCLVSNPEIQRLRLQWKAWIWNTNKFISIWTCVSNFKIFLFRLFLLLSIVSPLLFTDINSLIYYQKQVFNTECMILREHRRLQIYNNIFLHMYVYIMLLGFATLQISGGIHAKPITESECRRDE